MSSAQPSTDGVVCYSISIAGKALASDYQVLRIDVRKQVNRIGYALVEIRDGCVAEGAFIASDSDTFNPGKAITIAMGYGGDDKTVFTGIISKQSVSINNQSTSVLQLECKHPAVRMTNVRNNACHFDIKDSDIIKKIADKYSITAKPEATKVTHQQMVQYYATDWDFILTRAQANGQLVFAEDEGLSINKPETAGTPAAKLVYGNNILAFNADLNAVQHYPEVSSFSWQSEDQKLLEVKAVKPEVSDAGDLSSQELAEQMDNEPLLLQHGASLSKEDMQAWADAYWQNSAMANICGSVSAQGIAELKPGVIIELDGVGKHFNGKVWVNKVEHKMARGNWVSHIGFGLTSVWFGHKPDVHTPINNGLLPSVRGLQIGVVSKIDTSKDPQKSYRVQVKLPLISSDTEGVWARLGCAYAGKEYGCFFLPEVGDEVVLGFLDNDPRSPIVLSSLYSKAYPPAAEGKAEKPQKYLITKNQLKLCFDDENKIIHLETPDGSEVTLSDKDGISLKAKKDINIESTDGSIFLKAKKDLMLNAKGNFDLGAQQIEQHAKADCKIEATNVQQKAKSQFKAQGSLAELSASGNTTVKGAMVMIN